MTQATTTSSNLTIGLDVGDRKTHVCVLDPRRRVVGRASFATTQEAVRREFAARPASWIIMEVGPQSRWMAALLRELGHEVLVADARRVDLISRSNRKTDRRDAEMLARLGAAMPELLGSVRHRGHQAQADLSVVRARDLLVRMRTKLIQHVRGTLKVFGIRLPSCSAPSFSHKAAEHVPEALVPALGPVFTILQKLERELRSFDRVIEQIAEARYPEAAKLRQVNGVGPLTSLAFVLTIEDPARFRRSRHVGPWLGLCPRVQASGDSDPQLRITKAGNPYLRRLLVQSAHYVLGPFGRDCDLRTFGLRICERGGRTAKGSSGNRVGEEKQAVAVCLGLKGSRVGPCAPLPPASVQGSLRERAGRDRR